MKLLFYLALSVSMVPVVGQCQSFKLPEKVSFSSPEVCHKFDKDVIACANSLELQSPKDESPNFRKVSKFLTDYQKGCSNTNYIQYDRIEVVFNESPWFRIFYLAGWLRYGVQNNAQPNKMSRLLCAYAGMKTVIKVYNSSRNGRIDNNLDELVTADNKGKLKSWLEEKMN